VAEGLTGAQHRLRIGEDRIDFRFYRDGRIARFETRGQIALRIERVSEPTANGSCRVPGVGRQTPCLLALPPVRSLESAQASYFAWPSF
jgi:hypothetical protein